MNQIPNSAFFNAFIGTNPFELTHWVDGEVYGDADSWYVEVTLWGGPQVYDSFASWRDFTEADNTAERAFPVRLGPDQIRQALDYIEGSALTTYGRMRQLYLTREAAYEAGRWFAGHWTGHGLTTKDADQILQLAALLYAGEHWPKVLF